MQLARAQASVEELEVEEARFCKGNRKTILSMPGLVVTGLERKLADA